MKKTTLIVCAGSYAGFITSILLERIRINPECKVVIVEPSVASLRAGLTFVDVRPGLETGRLHLVVGNPVKEDLLQIIGNLNLWGERSSVIMHSPVIDPQLSPEAFAEIYHLESAKQKSRYEEEIRIVSQIHPDKSKPVSRVALIDCWPNAPQSPPYSGNPEISRRAGNRCSLSTHFRIQAGYASRRVSASHCSTSTLCIDLLSTGSDYQLCVPRAPDSPCGDL